MAAGCVPAAFFSPRGAGTVAEACMLVDGA